MPSLLARYPPYEPLMPNELVVSVDSNPNILFYMIILITLILCLEIASFNLVVAILWMMKKNSASFSEHTARMHRQFTLLLAAQVRILK